MPRRGGLTITRSGAESAPSANAVASPTSKRTSRPASAAVRRAEPIASALSSIPSTSRPGAATCSAKPPTPQYRSHTDRGADASTQAAPCAYRACAIAVFVWKNDCGRRCRSRLPTRMRSESSGVRTISSGPSRTALCSGWMFAVTTRSPGSAAMSAGRCLRRRGTASVERSTKRAMSSPSGERVSSTCLSSPRRDGMSYGVRRAAVIAAATAGSAVRRGSACRPQPCRSTPRPASSRIPRVGASTVPATTIFALLRNPSSGLATGLCQTAPEALGTLLRRVRACASFAAS